MTMSNPAESDDDGAALAAVLSDVLQELKAAHPALQEDAAAVDELDELRAARARLSAFAALQEATRAAPRPGRDDDPRLDTAA